MSPFTAAVPPSGIDLSALHILLVDDDQTFLDVLEGLLRSLGVQAVTRATSGSDATRKLATVSRVVDCILCDYSMAEGNGLQLLQSIRLGQLKYIRPDICFILVTVARNPELVKLAAALDVNGYLLKPATTDTIRTAIARGRSRPIRLDPAKYSQVIVPPVA